MTMYCQCGTCRNSPAQPAGPAHTYAETVAGGRLAAFPANGLLVHWSSRRFTQLRSTEIHHLVTWEHRLRVGASFYLYRNGNAPQACPQQLRLMGLGGQHRYVIGPAVAGALSIFQKNNGAPDPAEVVVVLGCGGYIDFDQNGTATGVTTTGHIPTLNIPG